jgi:choline dehydrogenase-like flavoprotein
MVSVKTGGGASTPVTFSQLPADVCCQALVTGARVMSPDPRVQPRIELNTLYHPVGTARMGRADDAPNIPRANTNLTCIVIGERIADWMRAE